VSALLSVLLVSIEEYSDIAGNSATCYVYFVGPNVRHFSDRNQTVYPLSSHKKKLIMASIIPKQRERCLQCDQQ
jgi:hypothetical protein